MVGSQGEKKTGIEAIDPQLFVGPQITFTGIDRRTDLDTLPRGVEYGVLFTASPEGRNRYSDRGTTVDILSGLAARGHRVALHVCGSTARTELVNGRLCDLTDLVSRIQVNGRVRLHELSAICSQYSDYEIITQATGQNETLRPVRFLNGKLWFNNHALLVDASGGRGQSPADWVRPATDKRVGFAGGLGPDNIVEEVRRIREVATGSWWIDMEGKLRDEHDWFDARRATDVLLRILADRLAESPVK